jgi:hypothetical protein
MKTVHSGSEAPQVCAREGCTTSPMPGETFCSTLHRRQHELVHGYEPHPDTQAPCALEGCDKPSRRMSRFCSSEHNVASAEAPKGGAR